MRRLFMVMFALLNLGMFSEVYGQETELPVVIIYDCEYVIQEKVFEQRQIFMVIFMSENYEVKWKLFDVPIEYICVPIPEDLKSKRSIN